MLERDPRVTDLVAVPGAYTPILTFLFNGVEIDVACGVVASKTLPEVYANSHVHVSACPHKSAIAVPLATHRECMK